MSVSLTEELEKLAALRDAGEIPEEVFAEAKKDLLQGRGVPVFQKKAVKPDSLSTSKPKEDTTSQLSSQTEELSLHKNKTEELPQKKLHAQEAAKADSSYEKPQNASPLSPNQPKNTSIKSNSGDSNDNGMITLFACLGMIVGIGLIAFALMLEVRSRDISIPILDSFTRIPMYGHSTLHPGRGFRQFVGGDSYNIMIEASLRAGEIAGGMIARAVYLTGGLILFFGSSIALGFSKKLSARK